MALFVRVRAPIVLLLTAASTLPASWQSPSAVCGCGDNRPQANPESCCCRAEGSLCTCCERNKSAKPGARSCCSTEETGNRMPAHAVNSIPAKGERVPCNCAKRLPDTPDPSVPPNSSADSTSHWWATLVAIDGLEGLQSPRDHAVVRSQSSEIIPPLDLVISLARLTC